MKNYKELINEQYTEQLNWECPPECRIEFVGRSIFNLTTYDSKMDIQLGCRIIEVVRCILDRTTFDYIEESPAKYSNYITVINLLFFDGMLEWGASIRGAWFDEFKSYSISNIEVKERDINKFFTDLLEWIELKNPTT